MRCAVNPVETSYNVSSTSKTNVVIGVGVVVVAFLFLLSAPMMTLIFIR